MHHDEDPELRAALDAIDPTAAAAVGETKERLIDALVEAASVRKDRWTILNEKPLTREAAGQLCAETGVC